MKIYSKVYDYVKNVCPGAKKEVSSMRSARQLLDTSINAVEELYGLMTLGSVDVGVREEFTFAPHTEDFTMSTKDLVRASLIMSATISRKLPLTRIEVGAEDFRNHAVSHIAAATEYLLWLQHNRFLGGERDLDSLPLLYEFIVQGLLSRARQASGIAGEELRTSVETMERLIRAFTKSTYVCSLGIEGCQFGQSEAPVSFTALCEVHHHSRFGGERCSDVEVIPMTRAHPGHEPAGREGEEEGSAPGEEEEEGGEGGERRAPGEASGAAQPGGTSRSRGNASQRQAARAGYRSQQNQREQTRAQRREARDRRAQARGKRTQSGADQPLHSQGPRVTTRGAARRAAEPESSSSSASDDQEYELSESVESSEENGGTETEHSSDEESSSAQREVEDDGQENQGGHSVEWTHLDVSDSGAAGVERPQVSLPRVYHTFGMTFEELFKKVTANYLRGSFRRRKIKIDRDISPEEFENQERGAAPRMQEKRISKLELIRHILKDEALSVGEQGLAYLFNSQLQHQQQS